MPRTPIDTSHWSLHAVVASLALTACGPPPQPPSELPLCPPIEIGAREATLADSPAPWRQLLLRPDPETAEPRACDRSPVGDTPDACTPGLAPLTVRADTSDEAIVVATTDDLTVVWIMTHDSVDGDAAGPVALVHADTRSLTVVAVGILRAPSRGVSLQLLDTGDERTRRRFLVAEGERCPTATPDACLREARVLALDGRTFRGSAVLDADGRCLEPARISLAFERTLVRGDGRPRRAVVQRTLRADTRGLWLGEEILVRANGQVRRSFVEQRRISFADGQLRSRVESPWQRGERGEP